MIEISVLETLADRAEAELQRVAAARPFLRTRCKRAEGLLVEHLAMPSQRVIRARVRSGELVGYLVAGSHGAVYWVEASGRWRCSCPDHHRRDQACKHALAAWALWRAGSAPRPAAGSAAAEEIPAEIVPIRAPRGRSLRRDRVRGDGELPVAAPQVIDRMAERMGVA